ncbi:MAG: cytidylate kinase-like family protein, partial [Spirochaetota bacterium]|nr:cytidylate kinase-like family protein [Spirochaetota bacterium]
ISLSEAEERVKSNESERGAFIKDYFFTDQSNPHYYDMVINSSRMALDDSAELIIYAMKKRGLL